LNLNGLVPTELNIELLNNLNGKLENEGLSMKPEEVSHWFQYLQDPWVWIWMGLELINLISTSPLKRQNLASLWAGWY